MAILTGLVREFDVELPGVFALVTGLAVPRLTVFKDKFMSWLRRLGRQRGTGLGVTFYTLILELGMRSAQFEVRNVVVEGRTLIETHLGVTGNAGLADKFGFELLFVDGGVATFAEFFLGKGKLKPSGWPRRHRC